MELTTHKLRISQSTVNTILSRAQGHYKSILLSAGADEMIFKTKNLECPWCAGVDRFSYTDKFGKGDSFCRHCGYHSGVDLLMKIKKFGYVDALRFMARFLNLPIHEEKTYRVTKTREQPSPVEEVWAASHALGEKDSAYAYLRSRGLTKCFPAALRASNRLRYAQLSEDGRSWDHSFYEGLVAEIVNSEGDRVSLHRTYLDKGRKAPVKAVKKVLGKGLSGCAVRLAETDESGVLGLAEGIETALSASELFGVPVWSVVAAFNFRNFVPPKSVRRIIIFGDSDKNFIGQREAYAGAAEIKQRHPDIEVEVRLPEQSGSDWNDVLMAQNQTSLGAQVCLTKT